MLISEVSYPGITAILAARITDSQGITPARATLTLPAAAVGTIAPVGDLTYGDGTNSETWPECRVANVTSRGGAGQAPVLIVLLEDARWKWAGGQISGCYNVPAEYLNTVPLVTYAIQQQYGNQNFTQVPVPPGEEPIRPETAKNAQDLCSLCLKAMGVVNYDVSAIDVTSYPSVEWDSEIPARALQTLVERYGCRVVYRKDTNSVIICKQGTGLPLPDGPFLYDSPSITPKPIPSKIVLRSDRIRYQRKFVLEMVLMEFDGSWRPANDVSYAPIINGRPNWTNIHDGDMLPPPPFLPNLPAGRDFEDAISIANYLYRAYRITNKDTDGTPMLFPDDNGDLVHPFNYLKQVYLLPSKVEVTKDDLGRRSPAPAQCFGQHERYWACGLNNPATTYDDTTFDTEVILPFSIDAEHGVIIFPLPVRAWKTQLPADGGDGTKKAYYPAPIFLETACYFAPQHNWQFLRKNFPMPVPGGLSDLTSYIIKPELLATVAWSYDEFNRTSLVASNTATITQRALHYLRGELAKLVPDGAETRTYCGVIEAYPDGAIQQITTEFAAGDKNKPCTTISVNTEHDVYQPTYEGRRLREEADLRTATQKQEDEAHADRQARGDKG